MRSLAFGDPPNHIDPVENVSCTGNTMTAQSQRVVKYWHRHDDRFKDGTRIKDVAYFELERDQSLETVIGAI